MAELACLVVAVILSSVEGQGEGWSKCDASSGGCACRNLQWFHKVTLDISRTSMSGSITRLPPECLALCWSKCSRITRRLTISYLWIADNLQIIHPAFYGLLMAWVDSSPRHPVYQILTPNPYPIFSVFRSSPLISPFTIHNSSTHKPASLHFSPFKTT